MTCAHVLGLIDAGPLADYPAAHLDAAWEHARGCGSCGPALTLTTALTTELSALPHPAPPADLAVAVLARIARLETAPTSRIVVQAMRNGPSSTRWTDPAAAGAAIAAGFAIVLGIALGEGPPLDVTSPRIGGMSAGLSSIMTASTWALTLVVSLAFYLAGLFAPLRGGGRRDG